MADQTEQAPQQNNQPQVQPQLQQLQQQPQFLQQYQGQYLQHGFAQQPLVQSQVVAQPISYQSGQFLGGQQVAYGGHQVAYGGQQVLGGHQLVGSHQVLGSQQVLGGQVLHQSNVQVSGVPVTSTIQREVVKGESRIEYVPYEKTIIEYEAVQRVEYVPKEKKITDYYAVEYQTEYIPQVYQDRYIEYVPTERVQERVEYQAIEKQVVHQPAQEVSQVYVSQVPVVTNTVTQVPVTQQLTSSQVHVLPAQTVVSGGQTILGGQQYVQGGQQLIGGSQLIGGQSVYQPFQQSVVYTHAPLQQHLLGSQVIRGGPIGSQVIPAAQKQQKKEEKGFLERIFE